jgi:hypothetical protein
MPERRSWTLVVDETPRMSLKGSLQARPSPLGLQEISAAGGGGAFHDSGVRRLPISFQVTAPFWYV